MVCCTNTKCMHTFNAICRKIKSGRETATNICSKLVLLVVRRKGTRTKEIHKRKGKRLNSIHNSTHKHSERVSSIFGSFGLDAKYWKTQSIKWAHQKEQSNTKDHKIHIVCILCVCWRKRTLLHTCIYVCGLSFFIVCTMEKNCMRNAGSLNRSFPTVEWNTSIGQQHQSTSSFRFFLSVLYSSFSPALSLSLSLGLYRSVFKFFFSSFFFELV